MLLPYQCTIFPWGNVVSTFILAITAIFIGRLLGGYGLYTLSLVMPSYGSSIPLLGLPFASTRFPAQRRRGQRAHIFIHSISYNSRQEACWFIQLPLQPLPLHSRYLPTHPIIHLLIGVSVFFALLMPILALFRAVNDAEIHEVRGFFKEIGFVSRLLEAVLFYYILFKRSNSESKNSSFKYT